MEFGHKILMPFFYLMAFIFRKFLGMAVFLGDGRKFFGMAFLLEKDLYSRTLALRVYFSSLVVL